MANIFISYRREDAGGHAGRLCDRLNARLGPDRVFMDVEDVGPGQDFVEAIDATVARCDHLLVVIGPRWLEAIEGRARSDADFVRHEILAGLRLGKTVVPVLVGGATMPEPSRLPSDLAELSRRNAVHIRDDRFDDDVQRLVGFLGARPDVARAPAGKRSWWLAAAAVLVAALLVGSWYAQREPPPPASLAGEWQAEMQKQGQQPYQVRFTLVEAGPSYTGTVRYPTGDGIVENVTLESNAIAFSTSHVPQFESAAAVIRYVGTVERDGIKLVSTDSAGVATGFARRVTSP